MIDLRAAVAGLGPSLKRWQRVAHFWRSAADQYQPAGYEPVTLNPPMDARLLNNTFSSFLVGTRQSSGHVRRAF
jgi:hypothetical protein